MCTEPLVCPHVVPTDLKEEPVSANAQLTLLLESLPLCCNRDLVDKFACDFIIYNSKSARNRLARTILGVHRTALELLPHYSRLVAIMERALPGFAGAIVNALWVRT